TLRAGDCQRHRRVGLTVRRRSRQQTLRDEGRQALAETDLLVEVVQVLHAELSEHGLLYLRADFVERQAEFPERLVEESLAERDGLRAPQALQIVPDGVARLGRDDEVDPRGVRHRALGGDDLHRLTVAQHGAQRRQPPVHLGRDAAIADVRVHRVGEVHHRGAARQAQDGAFGSEDVDLVRKEVDLDALEELLRGAVLLQLDEARQPFACTLLLHRVRIAAALVLPVGRDAGLRDAMHVLGADLRLDGYAVGTEERRMQRLVAVDPRDGDVVLEAPRHGLEYRVHDAERAIAGVRLVDDDAQAIDIDDLRQRRALARHLLVDAVEVLLARLDARRHLALDEGTGELLLDLLQEFLLVAARLAQRTRQHLVAVRVERLEAEVLELELHVVETQALRDGRVDLQRLAGDRPPPRQRHGLDGAHVVGAVGELDQDDPQVTHHREEHFAEGLRLRFLAALELNCIELRHAVDELRDVRAETRRQLVFGRRRVFDDVVQDRRDQRVGIEV